jgi:RNA-directed DNA polymerase
MHEAYRLTRKDGAPGVDGVMATDYEANLEANLWTFWDALSLAAIRHRRCAGPTSRKRTARKGCSAFHPSKIRWRNAPCRWCWRKFTNRTSCLLVRLPAGTVGSPGAPHIAERALGQASLLGDRSRHTPVFRFDPPFAPSSVPRPASHGWRHPTDDRQVAEGGSRGKRSPAPYDRGLPARGCDLTLPLEHLLALCAGRMVREGGETAPCGDCTLVRYADDALLAFSNLADAERVRAVLGKRLARFGLTLHPDKTRLVDFRPGRTDTTRHPQTDGTAFDFLGFTHVWGRSRRGRNMVRQITAKGRFARAVAAANDWCRKNRHRPIRDQHRHLSAMLRGHYAYYGIGGNVRRLRWYARQVVRGWQK